MLKKYLIVEFIQNIWGDLISKHYTATSAEGSPQWKEYIINNLMFVETRKAWPLQNCTAFITPQRKKIKYIFR